MDDSLSPEPVSFYALDQEDRAAELALTAAKMGVLTLLTIFGASSPLAGVVGIGLSEAFGMAISSFAGKRVQRMLTSLADKITLEDFKARQKDEAFQELFLDGVNDATRSRERDRLKMIASILATGVNEKKRLPEADRALRLLRSLDDLDLLVFLTVAESAEYLEEIDESIYGTSEAPTPFYIEAKDSERNPYGDFGFTRDIDSDLKASGEQLVKATLLWAGTEWQGHIVDMPETIKFPLEKSIEKLVSSGILIDNMPHWFLGGEKAERLHPKNRVGYRLSVIGESLAKFASDLESSDKAPG